MENTSDSLMPRPLLLCLKSEKIVCYSVPDNKIASRKLIEMIESKNSISNKKVIIKNAVRWRDSTL